MSVSDFVPEFWSTRLQRHLDRALVYAQAQVSNRNWEGEISEAGDTVHIQKIGDPTILDYVPGSDMAAPEIPTGTTQALVVDQFNAFNVAIDDVDAAQANVNLLDAFASRAGVKMAQKIDSYVAGLMVAGLTSPNKVGSSSATVEVFPDGTGDYTPYQLAVELRRLLAAQNAPLDSLWMAISPSVEAKFLNDDKYIETAAREETRTGLIGRVAGFDILRTTGVPTVTNGEVILAGAGNYATTFANQLTKMEAYRIEKQFGDAVKGLEVYGAKVIEPATLVAAYVSTAAEGS